MKAAATSGWSFWFGEWAPSNKRARITDLPKFLRAVPCTPPCEAPGNPVKKNCFRVDLFDFLDRAGAATFSRFVKLQSGHQTGAQPEREPLFSAPRSPEDVCRLLLSAGRGVRVRVTSRGLPSAGERKRGAVDEGTGRTARLRPRGPSGDSLTAWWGARPLR